MLCYFELLLAIALPWSSCARRRSADPATPPENDPRLLDAAQKMTVSPDSRLTSPNTHTFTAAPVKNTRGLSAPRQVGCLRCRYQVRCTWDGHPVQHPFSPDGARRPPRSTTAASAVLLTTHSMEEAEAGRWDHGVARWGHRYERSKEVAIGSYEVGGHRYCD